MFRSLCRNIVEDSTVAAINDIDCRPERRTPIGPLFHPRLYSAQMNFLTEIANYPLAQWVAANPPSWAADCILEWQTRFATRDEFSVRPFVKRQTDWVSDLPIEAIVGQDGHYAGQTWRDALFTPQYKSGKIADALHMLATNPGYYASSVEKDIYFSTCDGRNWFTDGGGNHRTVVGKFALAHAQEVSGEAPVFRAVRLRSYEVDWATLEAWRAFHALVRDRALNIQASVSRVDLFAGSQNGVTEEVREPVFWVCDCRMEGVKFLGTMLCARLTGAEFQDFTAHLLETRGETSRADRLRFIWRVLQEPRFRRLMFPGAPDCECPSTEEHERRRQEAYQRRHR
jgi:hypothetical protein